MTEDKACPKCHEFLSDDEDFRLCTHCPNCQTVGDFQKSVSAESWELTVPHQVFLCPECGEEWGAYLPGFIKP